MRKENLTIICSLFVTLFLFTACASPLRKPETDVTPQAMGDEISTSVDNKYITIGTVVTFYIEWYNKGNIKNFEYERSEA